MLLGNNQNNFIRPTYINAIYIRNVKLRNLHLIKALCTVQLHFGEKIGHTFLHPTNCSSCYLRSICIGQRSVVFVCIKQYKHANFHRTLVFQFNRFSRSGDRYSCFLKAVGKGKTEKWNQLKRQILIYFLKLNYD